MSVSQELLLVGSIPLENYQYQVVGRFTPFTYLVSGFMDFSQTNQFGSEPEYTISNRYDFDAVAWTGSHGYSDDGMQFDEDLISVAQVADAVAHTPHMMGGGMKYSGSLALSVPELRDQDSAQLAAGTPAVLTRTRAITCAARRPADYRRCRRPRLCAACSAR